MRARINGKQNSAWLTAALWLALAMLGLLHFGGVVPDNMKDLLSLSGVGRKTANLILGDVYGKPAKRAIAGKKTGCF